MYSGSSSAEAWPAGARGDGGAGVGDAGGRGAIADQAGVLGGPIARLLAITAEWTGCRWGELAGLCRENVDGQRGVLVIDPLVGSLHKSGSVRWLGPPKTPSSASTVSLPLFLVKLLRAHL
ncbi:hypothetical protein [Amycolatopsis sp. FDAARGOS 1241]|uniref:hypothetical protein n=1 Tax=Amycolatopsis sp. FDAARGOS 1241 TaxID=2778070 RepID=UPI00195152EB|nr:hypothetical protein [Amycolatopsis sp. FDAARGOS 1241]QRP44723.1 hypothetical protein I6J71_36665 [Amycolatopsis sp. FDAARGOS 1241]